MEGRGDLLWAGAVMPLSPPNQLAAFREGIKGGVRRHCDMKDLTLPGLMDTK